MKKKSLLVALLMVCLLVFTACGNNDEKPKEGDAAAPTEVKELKLATIAAVNTSMYDRIVAFTEKVKADTNGSIVIQVFPSDQLGDYGLVYEELMKGNIECTVNSIPSTYDSRADAIYTYYIASDYDELNPAYGPGSYLYGLMDEITSAKGVKFLNFDAQGMGGLGFTKVPDNYGVVGAPKNTIVRVSPTDIARVYMQGLGYQTQSINYGDLYAAMQTGVVEGWIGGNPTYNYLFFRDAIKVYIQTNDLSEMCAMMFHQGTWDSFTPEEQEIVKAASDAMWEQSLADCEADDEMYRKQMEEYGIQVLYLTEEELAAHAKFCREEVWTDPVVVKALTPEVLKGLEDTVANMNK